MCLFSKCSSEMNLEEGWWLNGHSSGLSQIFEGFSILAMVPRDSLSVACLSVCLSPEMNEEAFEAMSVTCNCPWTQQHRTNSSLALGTCLLSA